MVSRSREFNRQPGFGLTREIHCKMLAKYDPDAEQNCRLWMEDITGTLLYNPPDSIETAEQLNEWRNDTYLGIDGIHESLSDGRYLCMLMNTIVEGAIPKFNENLREKDAFRKRENIERFLAAAMNVLGCQAVDLFQVVDLFEKTNMGQVINGIYAVARKAQAVHPNWPALGPKEAKYNPRQFTEEQLKDGQNQVSWFISYTKGATQAGMTAPGAIRQIID